MSKRAIAALKGLLHLLCLAPFAWLLHLFISGALGLYPDPINYITHFTGDWTLYTLFASLAITPVRRLSPKLAFLIRFRRLLGLYAFFYASLHLATYIFLFSGYDVTTALAGLRSGHPGELIIQWRLIWPRMVDDVLKRRFIQVGLVAWTILLALACTSPAFIMRSMGGKNWQRLHRLIYVAAIAGIIHYWWLVKKGNLAPWKDTVVLAVLLLARLVYTTVKARRRNPLVANG
ncbi:MAG TPA: protein-methionine-sulfoxide reductase heme-binding subunit MsrQ [Edaphobacter sp.]|jgi:sulfoxide reductase heme-binding subunit YedZ|nr:protein-methionine-sulfoxide reductase heme-binding subunit MsrQ [Edaphobacter sp.]